MGFTRTPRPHYFEHGVIEFFVKAKVVWYRILLWNKEGTHLSVMETGNYINNKDKLVKEASQTFGSVSKE